MLRSEELARENLAVEPDEGEFLELDPYNPDDFDTLVREALDDLPDLLIKALDRVPVRRLQQGPADGAYGLYQGDTVARDNYHDRIIIFRDTLLRDFGHDPDLLRDQVTRTVRHELAPPPRRRRARRAGTGSLRPRRGHREPRRPPDSPAARQVRADQREHRQQCAGAARSRRAVALLDRDHEGDDRHEVDEE